jgi:hypothetical protein
MAFIKFLLALLNLHIDGGTTIDPNGAVFTQRTALTSVIDPNG